MSSFLSEMLKKFWWDISAILATCSWFALEFICEYKWAPCVCGEQEKWECCCASPKSNCCLAEMLLNWLNRISLKAILIRDFPWRLSQYLYLFIFIYIYLYIFIYFIRLLSLITLSRTVFHSQSKGLLEVFSFPMYACKNYLLEYIWENKLTTAVLCWAVLAYFYPSGGQRFWTCSHVFLDCECSGHCGLESQAVKWWQSHLLCL